MRRWWLFLNFAAVAWAQTAAKTASLQGTVVNAVTGQPIPRAHVEFRGESNGLFGALTAGDGSFSITGLPPGKYDGDAERVGFVRDNGAFGHPALTLQSDEYKTDVTIKLVPTGAILGRIIDADGEPVEGASVDISGSCGWLHATTDRDGNYRIGGLAAGRYRVSAGLPNPGSPPEIRTDGTEEVFNATTYYPGTTSLKSAARVTVGPAADVTGVDIRLVRAPIICVSGRVVGVAPGTDHARVTANEPLGVGQTAFIQRDGTFRFWRLSPGKHVLLVDTNGAGSDDIGSAGVPIEVAGSNIEGVELRLARIADLAGSLEFDDDQAKQMPKDAGVRAQRRIRLTELQTNESPNAGAAASDNTFQFRNVPPGVYRVEVTPNNVYVKSMRFGSTVIDGSTLDLSGGAAGGELSILLSSATATISGAVKDDNPVGSRVVLIEASGARKRWSNAGSTGAWTISGLPPGSYKIVAIPKEDAELALQGDIDSYEESMEAIEIHPGDKLARDLRIATVR
jgi:hypothetical protein